MNAQTMEPAGRRGILPWNELCADCEVNPASVLALHSSLDGIKGWFSRLILDQQHQYCLGIC